MEPIFYVLTVIVFNQAIKQDAGHGNSIAREVRVVVHAFTNLKASGRISVSRKKRENVVLTLISVARKRHKIGRAHV